MIEQTNRQANSGASDPDLVAMLDGWATTGHGSLPRRLAHALRHVLAAGVLPGGWRLPPERLLAGELAVGRATVTQALDELRGEGLLTSTRGSGTYVAGPAEPVAVGTRVADHLTAGTGIDLATGNPPDLSHLPPASVDMCLLNASGGGPAVNATGLPALREAIAERYTCGAATGRQRATAADQIHVTSGAHEAIALLVGSLVGRRRAVALAEVNYPGIFDVLDGCGAEPAVVSVDRAGMLPESLDAVLTRDRPGVLYHQAGPHNPSGRVTPPSRVRALADVVDRHGVTVIEDAALAPLAFGGDVPMLADLCHAATVVSVGSMSKTCWAGLRIGWMRGPNALIERTTYRHLAINLGPAVPSQLLALELLPHLDDIAAERRRRLANIVDRALDQLRSVVPEAEVTRPDGGSVLWTRFPIDDSGRLVNLARRHGVRIAPGSIHVAGRAPGPYVRICVDRTPEHVREGLDRLARAWRELAPGSAG